MRVYLDHCIIDEWLKFKSSGVSLAGYAEGTTKDVAIIRDLEAFGKILDIRSAIFLYSFLIELESSKHRRHLFDDLVSQDNFVKVPAIGLRICMADQKLPDDTMSEIGECQSYFASHIRKLGPKNIKDRNDLMRYMREKFFDPMHIDSALKAGADIFLTIDYTLLRSINQDSNIRTFLAYKIRMFTPSEFIQKIATTHNTG